MSNVLPSCECGALVHEGPHELALAREEFELYWMNGTPYHLQSIQRALNVTCATLTGGDLRRGKK